MFISKYYHGILLAISISILAYMVSFILPIGIVTISIILGAIFGNIFTIPKKFNDGINYAQDKILAFAIALMGINLDFTILSSLGFKTILLIILSISLTIYSSILIGRFFKIDTKLALLLGFGNGVCGSSAISAVAPIIKPNQNFIGLSIAIVNLLGIIGIFLMPFIAFLFGLDEINSGILVGNTLQAVGQVTASGFSISNIAGVGATTVKMGRVLLLTPLIFILIYIYHKNQHKTNNYKQKITIPLFIIFFIFFSIIGSLDFVSNSIKDIISLISHISLVVAMGAIGLKIQLKNIKQDGKIALKVATLVFIIQISFTVLFLTILS
jgi:uncharacterized integral membrane protein (TIGR00698 family)